MKKLIYCAAALAAMIFAGSCQRENLEPVAQGNTVTYTVELPGTQTKGFMGTVSKVDELVYEVWKTEAADERDLNGTGTDGKAKATLLYQKTVPMVNQRTVITLNLVQDQEYTVLFWAQKQGTGVYNTEALTDVHYAKTWEGEENDANCLYSNQESYEAYYATEFISDEDQKSRTVVLKRPFAQLNLGTKNTQMENTGKEYGEGEYNVEVVSSKVTVSNVGTRFNVADNYVATPTTEANIAVAGATSVTFETATDPSNVDGDATSQFEYITVGGQQYEYVAMNYLFATGANVTVSYEINTKLSDKNGNNTTDAKVTNTVYQVPLQENYRTNIVGNLLTSETEYEVVIDASWAGDDVIRRVVNNSEELADAIDNAKSGDTIYIDGEVTMPYFTNKALTFFGLSEKAIVKQSPATHIDEFYKGAELNFNNVTLVGTSYKNNTQGYQKAVKETYTDCKFQDYIMFAGDVTIVKNCEFTSNVGQYFWTGTADNITFTECTFNGLNRAVKVCTVGNEGNRVVTFTDCDFSANSTTPEKAAIEIDGSKGSSYVVNINGCTHTGFAAGANTGVTLFNVEGAENVTVIVDGSEWKGNGLFEDENGNKTVASTEALKAALSTSPAQVNVMAGRYTFPASSIKNAVIINCEEGTVFTGTSGLNIKGATVIGATFENKDGVAASGTIYGTFKECTFDGSEALRWCYSEEGKDVVFEDCVIKTDFRGFHFDGMKGNVIFRRCEINGFNAYGGEGTATFENCVFGNDESSYNGLNIYSNTVLTDCQFNYISGKTNFIDMEGTGKTLTITNCTATLDGVAKPVTDFVGGSKINQNTVILNGKECVMTAAQLTEALADGSKAIITLAPGVTYEGTFHVLKDKQITSADADNKSMIKGRVHVNSANATFTNVSFDRNETNSNEPNNTTSNALQYKAIVMIYGDQTHTIKFEGCNFYNSNGTHKSAITNVACDLIVDNCYFEGKSSSIYSQANLSVTNSTFNYTGGNNVILSINGCGDNGGKVIFKNNEITNKIFALSQFLSTVGFGNGTYHFDVQENTGAGFDYYFLNETRVANKTFANGSMTF